MRFSRARAQRFARAWLFVLGDALLILCGSFRYPALAAALSPFEHRASPPTTLGWHAPVRAPYRQCSVIYEK